MDLTQFNNIDIPNEYGFGLHNNLLSEVSTPRTFTPDYFHVELKPETLVTNQKSSGRCWMFAGLNILRYNIISQLSLPNSFEFSQSYLFFWDKLERMNYLIDTVTDFHENNMSLDDRKVQFIMKDPFGDGGQWSMFVNLVNKYGLVPKSAHDESVHSSNSRGVNMVLCQMFRDYVSHLYQGKDQNKKEFLKKTYIILTRFFGKPPQEFNFEYKKNNKIITETFTPIQFRDFCKVNLDNYVSIVHDPRNNYKNLYTIDQLNNMSGGSIVKYLNLPMERVQELTRKSLDNNGPVWFGSDVGQFFHRKSDVLDENMFAYKQYLGLDLTFNKKDRLETGESIPSHAMVFSGYHQDKYGQIDYWKIENSWGKHGKWNGHLVCSNKWFQEYTYQIVIDKSLLTAEEQALWNDDSDITVLPLWDPLGTLA